MDCSNLKSISNEVMHWNKVIHLTMQLFGGVLKDKYSEYFKQLAPEASGRSSLVEPVQVKFANILVKHPLKRFSECFLS